MYAGVFTVPLRKLYSVFLYHCITIVCYTLSLWGERSKPSDTMLKVLGHNARSPRTQRPKPSDTTPETLGHNAQSTRTQHPLRGKRK